MLLIHGQCLTFTLATIARRCVMVMGSVVKLDACKYYTVMCTEDPCYNDSVCYQMFCCKIKSAVINKLDQDPSKA